MNRPHETKKENVTSKRKFKTRSVFIIKSHKNRGHAPFAPKTASVFGDPVDFYT